eukprot:2095193-Rhodomonas_salina.1
MRTTSKPLVRLLRPAAVFPDRRWLRDPSVKTTYADRNWGEGQLTRCNVCNVTIITVAASPRAAVPTAAATAGLRIAGGFAEKIRLIS